MRGCVVLKCSDHPSLFLVFFPFLQRHVEPFLNDIVILTARALVVDSYFATADSRAPVETASTPYLLADFDDEGEYKALYHVVKGRIITTLQAIAKSWPEVALSASSFLVEQAVSSAFCWGRVHVQARP